MSESFEDNYMNLTNTERSEMIFKDIQSSYAYWQVKKSVGDELQKNSHKYANQDIS